MMTPHDFKSLRKRVGTQAETWMPVPGWASLYEVSDLGRVRSLDRIIIEKGGKHRRKAGRVLRQAELRGYRQVCLCDDRGQRTVTVHILVARAFIGEAPGPRGIAAGTYQVNHKNGDKSDNRVDNLEWVTREQNAAHAQANGLMAKGDELPHSRLSEREVRHIKSLIAEHPDSVLSDIGDRFGVSRGTISDIARGVTWKHVSL